MATDPNNDFKNKRRKFLSLNLYSAIDWEKFNLMSISHHSTAIEGSSLTEDESRMLLSEGTTAKGKPLTHHLMEEDHYNALGLISEMAKKKILITPGFIQDIAAKVMQNTGGMVNTISGSFDVSKGEFRKCSVSVGTTIFMDFQKVPEEMKKFCNSLSERIKHVSKTKDIYNLAFDAHFSLVSIHPFGDGNGRVSRLLMNYILLYHKYPPAIVFKEDKADYYRALDESRKTESTIPIRDFLYYQQAKYFSKEIEMFNKRNISLNFIF